MDSYNQRQQRDNKVKKGRGNVRFATPDSAFHGGGKI